VREVVKREGWRVVLDTMRWAGWAVVLFSPKDLEGADRQRFEERLDDYGLDLVAMMAPETEMEDV
jgi:hypothetical protein